MTETEQEGHGQESIGCHGVFPVLLWSSWEASRSRMSGASAPRKSHPWAPSAGQSEERLVGERFPAGSPDSRTRGTSETLATEARKGSPVKGDTRKPGQHGSPLEKITNQDQATTNSTFTDQASSVTVLAWLRGTGNRKRSFLPLANGLWGEQR